MTETALTERLERNRPTGLALCARLEEEIRQLGLPPSETRPVEEAVIGPVRTLCRTGSGIDVAMSP